MKYITIFTAVLLPFLFAANCNAAIVADFQFSDAAGTGLANTANAVPGGATWNFNLNGSPGEGATDGLGSFVFGSNAVAGSSAISSDYTRVLDISDVSSGTFRFEYEISSWDMDDTPGLNGTMDQEGITLQIRDSANNNISLVSAIAGNDTSFRIRHAVNGVGGTAAQNNFGLTGSNLLIWAEGNLTTGTFTTGYNDGTGETTLIANGSGLTNIAEIRLIVAGDPIGWSANDSIGLNFVTLNATAVPEPSSLALLSIAGLAVAARCRKRTSQVV